MKEYMGLPHFPEEEEPVEDLWTYATTIGDEWEVITREDGTLTVKKKDAV